MTIRNIGSRLSLSAAAASLIGLAAVLGAGCHSPYLPAFHSPGAGPAPTKNDPQNLPSYTISFDSQGADVPASPAYLTASGAGVALGTMPSLPSKGSSHFAGWWTQAGGGGIQFTSTTAVSSSATVYAWWTDSPVYIVTFDPVPGALPGHPGSGSAAGSQFVVAGAPAAALTTPTQADYDFAGWCTDPGNPSGSRWTLKDGAVGGDPVSGDIRLYSVWTAHPYAISYHLNGGADGGNPNSFTVEQAVALIDPSRLGYDFAGWYSDTGLSSAFGGTIALGSTGDLSLYAKWTAHAYSIAYTLNGGAGGANPLSYTIESPAIALADPAKTGYLFGGWYSDPGFATACSSIPAGSTGPVAVYAKWNSYSYAVTFDGQGADVQASPSSMNVASPATAVDDLPAPPARSGYHFAGWWTQTGGGGAQFTGSTVVAGNVTVYAKWSTATVYTLSFDSQGGAAVDSIVVEAGQRASSPVAPVRPGYAFSGWFRESDCVTAWDFSTDVVSSDRTLYAKWTLSTYAIDYALDGGANSPSNPDSYSVLSSTIVFAAPNRDDYDFGGWYQDAGLTSTVVSIPSGSTGSRSLYAKWTPTAYAIAYHLDGGANSAFNPASYTVLSAAISLQAPSRADYVFDGWYSDPGFASIVASIPSGSSGDRNLYAKWRLNVGVSATIEFPADGSPGFSGGLSVAKGATVTVSVAQTFVSYQWYLDGAPLGGETARSISLGTASLAAGTHELLVLVANAAGPYSGRCVVTVNN